MPQTIAPGQVVPVHQAPEVAKRARMAIAQGQTMASRTDERLVVLARGGSERAYEEILRRYDRQLHSYCAQMLDPSRAEDAVQQTFLQAFVALRRGSKRDIALRPWLYRIAHNCAIDMLRKNGWDYDELDPEYDGVPQPPRLFEQKQELEKLVASLRSLPESQRRALTAREMEGKSYSEIAAELGHTSSSVRQLIFRARTAVRNMASILLPVGALRARFAAHAASATDAHQAAFAASAGGEAAGAGLAGAAAALLAGVSLFAAGVTGDRHDQQATRPALTALGASPIPASDAALAENAAVVPERRAGPRGKTIKVAESGKLVVGGDGAGVPPPSSSNTQPGSVSGALPSPAPGDTTHAPSGAPSSGSGPGTETGPTKGSSDKARPPDDPIGKPGRAGPRRPARRERLRHAKPPHAKRVGRPRVHFLKNLPRQQRAPKRSVPHRSVPKPSNAPKGGSTSPRGAAGPDTGQVNEPRPGKGRGPRRGNGQTRGPFSSKGVI